MKSVLLVLMGVASAAVLAGCSPSVMIRSEPPGAKAYVDDVLVGTTPFDFSVKRSDLKSSYRLRLEKGGFEHSDQTIGTRVAPGRIVGAFFSLGIVYLFKSPRDLVAPQVVYLEPSKENERHRRLGQDLRELQQRRDAGTIT